MDVFSASIFTGLPPTSTRSHDSDSWSASQAIRSRTSGGRPRSSRRAMKADHSSCRAAERAAAKVSAAVISHDSAGVKPRISCSRSTTIRVATLCTRPADRPPATFFQRIGETW